MRKSLSLLAVAFVAIFLAFPIRLVAQGSAAATTSATAPFPTRLRVAVKAGKVELSWVDSPIAVDSYVVYRHTTPVNASNLSTATKLGIVAKGIQSYADVPPDSSDYYYLVLALAAGGNPYEVFMSAGNATAAPTSIKPASLRPAQSGTSPKTVAPAVSAGPVEELSAQSRGESIVLNYKGAQGRSLVLYRGTAPIGRASDLLNATLVATFQDKEGSFVDFPVPGIEYWYALLVENDLKAGRIDLIKGKNATAEGASIEMTKQSGAIAETSPVSRTPPLPAFLLDAATGVAVPSNPAEIPSRRTISPDTEKALAGLLALAPPIKRPQPQLKLLSEELAAPSGGEDYSLSLIVKQKLVPGKWREAEEQLRKYLSLNRSEKAVSRARFYLGQALAFSGSYREAFFEFLSARALHPTESAPWIEYVLAALRKS